MPRLLSVCLCLLLAATAARAEDGHELWLRYRPVEAQWQAQYRAFATTIVPGESRSPTLDTAQSELARGLGGMLAQAVPVAKTVTDGAVIIGTPASSPDIAGLKLPLAMAGTEGYVIRSPALNGHAVTVIAANSDIGVLYGVFAFLRRIQTRQPIDRLDITDAPKLMVRVLNHWDNLDGSVERGYAGASLWRWQTLPAYRDPRYGEYARADASIGINGAVLNNVNSSSAILTSEYIEKIAALAEEFRPWGV
jgi:alpha-glucuronidase